jgi:hypothetical protein
VGRAVSGLGIRYEVPHNTTSGQAVLVSTPSSYLAYVPDDKIRFPVLTAFSVFDAMSLGDYFSAFQRLIFPLSIGSSNPRRKELLLVYLTL